MNRRVRLIATCTACFVAVGGATVASYAADSEGTPADRGRDIHVSEDVYVETETDTDGDGRADRVHIVIERARGGRNLPVALEYSPYFGGTNNVPYHNVMMDRLPQDERARRDGGEPGSVKLGARRPAPASPGRAFLNAGYAYVKGYSLGNGQSTGCPTVGDVNEALGAKAVIDWLNGRASGFDAQGRRVTADWASGNVGMFGVSYNGTLPNMVATTGVQGLKAIIPVAAISNWYDYYRANGLVVSPGGYPGEDADVLGRYVNQNRSCGDELDAVERAQDRATGDVNAFWKARNYVPKAKDVKAAVFIMHGQSDWNVRQKQAIQWWEALAEAQVPRKMWLHRGGHGYANRRDTEDAMVRWFDAHVVGDGGDTGPTVEVQDRRGRWTQQPSWPHPGTSPVSLAIGPGTPDAATFTDTGRSTSLADLVADPDAARDDRIVYTGTPFGEDTLLSGTPQVDMTVAVENRRAANLTVAVVDYDERGRATVVTRGWADPQNHASLESSEPLEPGKDYRVSFTMEPKQYTFAAGHRLGVVVASTDKAHTLRPSAGTRLRVGVGEASTVTLNLGPTP